MEFVKNLLTGITFLLALLGAAVIIYYVPLSVGLATEGLGHPDAHPWARGWLVLFSIGFGIWLVATIGAGIRRWKR